MKEGYIFLFYGDKILVMGSENLTIPRSSDSLSEKIEMAKLYEFNSYNEVTCLCGELLQSPDIDGYMLFDVRALFSRIDEKLYRIVAHAFHLVNWERNSRYCGCCGVMMEWHPTMLAKICSGCNRTFFPRISPAIIVAIVNDDKLLLARGPQYNFYSLIAGFVEPGETLEEGLRREIREEVGLEVMNIKYFASQPWPFPDSLMIGFTAEYESGELTLDESEIVEAGWYTADEIPEVPSRISIAGYMIDWFKEQFSSSRHDKEI